MADHCPLTPCSTCPWRIDSVGGPAIPNFSIEKARNLSNTVGRGDDFRPIMACHGSDEDEEYPCVGYLIVEGWTNLRVRLAALDGRIPLDKILERNVDLDLHPDFASMLEALEEAEVARG